MDEEKEKYLHEKYYNAKSPGSFAGINKIYYHVKKDGKFKFTKEEIQKWLQSQETHTTNQLVKKQNKRRKVVVPFIDYMWDIDTASFKNYSKKNDGYGYFILAIDIMSRFVWTQAIQSPSGEETAKVLSEILKSGRKPLKLRSDKGTEFSNKIMRKLYKKYDIDHFVTQNETKANFAERCIQTIKAKLMRYMRSKQTYRWVDVLASITDTYNNTIHRSIKQTPASVSKRDEIKLWKLMYFSKQPIPKIKKYKFNVDEVVRVSKLRETFQRYYSEHWTNELFIIKERSMKQYIPTYSLTDYAGEEIEGVFYESELQRVYVDENTTYNIEKVLRKRTRNGRKESLVRWMGWPKKFDSWILTKDITSFQKLDK
jgi:hypothetical protein